MDASDAFLQFRFSAIGLMPDVGATALLTSVVGPAKAVEIFMLAEKLDPQRCAELNLVSRISNDLPHNAAQRRTARRASRPRSHRRTPNDQTSRAGLVPRADGGPARAGSRSPAKTHRHIGLA